MDRFLVVQFSKTWNNTDEVMNKIPRAPNGWKWTLREISYHPTTYTSGNSYTVITIYNDKAADVPSGVTRKFLGSITFSHDHTNHVVTVSHYYPTRGSHILNEPYITATCYNETTTSAGIVKVVLELMPASAIEQFKSDLLSSD